MATLSRLLVPLLLSTAALAAGEGPRGTYFAESLLSRCDLVVRGKVRSRTALATGVVVTALTVEETLLGKAPGSRILLSSPDPTYHGDVGQTLVVFLRTSRTGRGHETRERFLVQDDTGRARLRMARVYIELEAIESSRERLAATRAVHLSNLAGADEWARDNAVRELAWFTRHWADRFDVWERDRLDAVRERLPGGPLRDMLTASLRKIDESLVRRGATSRRRPGPDAEAAYRAALAEIARTPNGTDRARKLADLVRARPARIRKDLAAFLDDAAAPVRRAAAYFLGEVEHAPAATALMGVLDRPREATEVRRDAIRALGIVKCEAVVPRLEAIVRENEEGLVRSALMALARIGTPRAAGALAARRVRSKGTEAEEVAVRRLIDFVGSEAFRRQEAVLARLRKERLRSDE